MARVSSGSPAPWNIHGSFLGRILPLGALLSLLLSATGCFDEVDAECCALGMQRMCLCVDGSESSQSCGSGGWASCDCSCVPWETRTCLCENGEDGLRVCGDDGQWGDCGCESARFPDSVGGECGPGETFCDAVGCVNTAHSETNCGACGVTCQGCDRCIRGECTETCCPDQTNCGSSRDPFCVYIASDTEHCGACNNACADDERCVGGQCMR